MLLKAAGTGGAAYGEAPEISEGQQQSRSTMSAELDLSPPEVPEATFIESLLRYGLFLGAIFQLICILAILIPTSSKGHEQEETEATDGKTAEQMKKSKGPVPQIRQKLKKESKKKR